MDPCGRMDLYTNTGFDNRSDGQLLYKTKKEKGMEINSRHLRNGHC